MKKKTDVEVMINNKKYVICGYESPEYIEHIAAHINKKMNSLKGQDWHKNLDADLRTVLLNINLVDDYFKANEKIKTMEEEYASLKADLFEIKHEVVSKSTRVDELEKELLAVGEEYRKAKEQIAKLTTALELTKHQ